jgi:hypothetical protein
MAIPQGGSVSVKMHVARDEKGDDQTLPVGFFVEILIFLISHLCGKQGNRIALLCVNF